MYGRAPPGGTRSHSGGCVPLYDYQCDSGHVYEKRESFGAPARQPCEQCGKPALRLLNAPPLIFRGGGWYKTESRPAEPKENDKSSDDSDSKDSKSSKKSKSKSKAKSKSGSKSKSRSESASSKRSTNSSS